MLRANRPILAFFDSIKSLRVRQLALILKAGYDPNLMINARGQNGLQFLIDHFNATDAHFRLSAPVNKAAYLSTARLLLDSGLDPNAVDLLANESVLFDAIRFDDREMVALLLNYVDLSLRNKSGETALMCAARFGSRQVTRALLEQLRHLDMDGYFLRQRNRFGLTPLEIARAENMEAATAITKHLVDFGPHTGALARSMSHHQLNPIGPVAARRAVPFGVMGAAVVPASSHALAAHRRAARGFMHADEYISPSDYDSDVALLGIGPSPRANTMAGAPAAFGYRPLYDPRAAEFSQYLLEQHRADRFESNGASGHGRRRKTAYSDNDDEIDDEDAGAGAAADDYCGPAGSSRPGVLMRSRSCLLGPSAAASSSARHQQKAAAVAAKKQTGTGAKTASGWQDQSSGGQ